jgi:hypothetical protein
MTGIVGPRRDVYEKLGQSSRLKPVEEFELRQFREAGMSIAHCASYFHVSIATKETQLLTQ